MIAMPMLYCFAFVGILFVVSCFVLAAVVAGQHYRTWEHYD